MKRKPSPQPSLFIIPAQPRRSHPEPIRIYRAVLRLRFHGTKVYRGGRSMHLVNGKRRTDGELISMAGM